MTIRVLIFLVAEFSYSIFHFRKIYSLPNRQFSISMPLSITIKMLLMESLLPLSCKCTYPRILPFQPHSVFVGPTAKLCAVCSHWVINTIHENDIWIACKNQKKYKFELQLRLFIYLKLILWNTVAEYVKPTHKKHTHMTFLVASKITF